MLAIISATSAIPVASVISAGSGFGLPVTVALAAVAVIGYVFGRRSRQDPVQQERPEELFRAMEIARQLETIASSLRRDLASHHAEVKRFKREIDNAGDLAGDATWQALRAEAERVLTPTLRLAGQVATAYDQLRQQTQSLSNFSGGRTDPVTGLNNRRGLSELLEMELSGHEASSGDLSVAVISIDSAVDLPSTGRSDQQERMLRAAEFIRTELRDRDLAARYGVDELVIVMPNTRLFGASVFGRRLRKSLAEQAGILVSCGLAQSRAGDTAKTLLTRADSALYSAKAAGGGQFLHTGQAIRADEPENEGPGNEGPGNERPGNERIEAGPDSAATDVRIAVATVE